MLTLQRSGFADRLQQTVCLVAFMAASKLKTCQARPSTNSLGRMWTTAWPDCDLHWRVPERFVSIRVNALLTNGPWRAPAPGFDGTLSPSPYHPQSQRLP